MLFGWPYVPERKPDHDERLAVLAHMHLRGLIARDDFYARAEKPGGAVMPEPEWRPYEPCKEET